MTLYSLHNKICVITGAAQGIGLATARVFAQRGATVILCDINASTLEAACAQCLADCPADAQNTAVAHVISVVDRAQVEAMMNQVKAQFGRIDVLINNAGITRDARLQKMTLAEFDQVIDVNLRGVFHCSQVAADIMVAQGKGTIINATSIVGLYGNFGQTNYAASKFGVIGFTKTWARELGPKGVRVNAVAPGFIDTPILRTMPEKVVAELTTRVPLRRLGQPEDIANTYAFLASDDAAYINGVVIEVGGGLTI